MSNAKKVYIASSWRNPGVDRIANIATVLGHEVFNFRRPHGRPGFQWTDINDDFPQWDLACQWRSIETSPVADEAFRTDFHAMEWADTCLLYLPCGRSAHTEAGYMKGKGKKVHVIMHDLEPPELMYLLYDSIRSIPSLKDPILLIEAIDNILNR